MENEFIMLKPDAVQRNLVGEIISRIEKTGLKLVALKFIWVTKQQAEQHYEVHKQLPFYSSLLSYIQSGPVVTMIVAGKDAVVATRKIVGSTNPLEASPGTIRGDLGLTIGRNLIHASDSVENAEYESAIYFSKNELLEWNSIQEPWIIE